MAFYLTFGFKSKYNTSSKYANQDSILKFKTGFIAFKLFRAHSQYVLIFIISLLMQSSNFLSYSLKSYFRAITCHILWFDRKIYPNCICNNLQFFSLGSYSFNHVFRLRQKILFKMLESPA